MAQDGLRPLVIIGTSEIAIIAREYFACDSDYTPIAFAIGDGYAKVETMDGLPLVPMERLAERYPPSECFAFVAIGDTHLNRLRARYYREAKQLGYRFASYISSHCFIWHNVEIGENCFILENNVLQPFVKVGNNVILWSGNHIGHRTEIYDSVFITSHVVISGLCKIGQFSYIGVNSSIAHNVDVGSDNFVAMATTIATSTPPDTVHQGNPAEIRKVASTRFCRVPKHYFTNQNDQSVS